MPILDCNVDTCYYNKSNQCCREEIEVEGQDAESSNATACGSYKDSKTDRYSSSCHTEDEPETTLGVGCEAVKCIFNEAMKCNAEHIGIAGKGAEHYTETECASFRDE